MKRSSPARHEEIIRSGILHHHVSVAADSLTMKCRLSQPALPAPEFTFAGQQTITNQSLEEIRVQRHRLLEVPGIGGQDVFNVGWVVKEVGRDIEEARAHNIALLATARDEPQNVTIEIRHHTENQVSLDLGRERSRIFLLALSGRLSTWFMSYSPTNFSLSRVYMIKRNWS